MQANSGRTIKKEIKQARAIFEKMNFDNRFEISTV
jgi:hypothetical protein